MTSNKLKFSPKYQAEFINELRLKVKEYFETNKISKFGNSESYLKSTFMVLLYLLPFIFMLTGVTSSLLGTLFSWILMGFGMAGVGMVLMHDANHKSFSKHASLNKWLGKSLYFLGGFPPNWRHQHNMLHHGFTNIDGHDEDIDAGPVLRLSPNKPLLKLHKYQHFYAWFLYSLMTLMWVTTKDFKQLFRHHKKGILKTNNLNYSKLMIDLILSKIVYYGIFIVLPMLFIPVAWYWIILSFLLMHLVSGFILTIIFQTAHVMPTSIYPVPDNQGNMENNWAIHQLLTTSNYAPKSRFFSWMIGGLNYQVEHHLFPNISHVHYRKISTLVKATTEKYKLPYYVQPNFLAALLNHFRMLRKLGSA
ncbi:MAG: acyl-CoA desaturase [Bacteroidales bacterium]|nr:acyl-CoA desaturase [Bacteroidales bacterium]